MKRFLRWMVIALLAIPWAGGCMKLALRSSSSVLDHLGEAIFEECDPVLAAGSIPAELKVMEGLLKSDPTNPQLLTALAMGFTGYSMLFVEEEDPGRASRLYLRARDYGFRALRRVRRPPEDALLMGKGLGKILEGLGERDLPPLFWMTLSWFSWIHLNLDRPKAVAQLGPAMDCVKRILEMDPNYFYGSPYVLAGTALAASPPLLGGDPERAKAYFEKAVAVSNGRFSLVFYQYAKAYAVRVQDEKLFVDLLEEILTVSTEKSQEVCLLNTVMKEKAKRLLAKKKDFFF